MHGPHGLIRPLSPYGLAVLAALAAIYLVSQILRNSIGVIAPDLARELGLTAAQLGILSSAFFVAFACAQIPLGIGIDRFGPKLCMLVCAIFAVGGAALFAVATTPAGLIVARVLMGLGSCCYLMAPLAFFARRFAPDRFTTLAGIHIGLGTLGTLAATAPLAFFAAAIGWRMTFMLIAGTIALCGLLLLAVVPGGHGGEMPRRESLRESMAGFAVVLRTPSVMRLFGMHFMGYAGFTMVVGLWGGPYLAHVYGYGLVQRGDLLFLAAAAQSAGLFLGGPLERWFGGFKLPVILGSMASGGLLVLLAIVGTLSPGWLMAWLLAFGLISAYAPLLLAHGRALFPPEILGRGMTLLNIGSFGGVFVFQAVTGAMIDLFPASEEGAYPLAAYRAVFALQGACILLGILPYLGSHVPGTGKQP